MKVLLGSTIIIALFVQVALADVGPPAHMQITESEPGLYTVQWRVPKALLPRAVPSPQLPETCRPSSEGMVLNQPGAWLFTQEWSCETTLAGQEVGMRYPFPDLALTSVVRVDFLSGDRFAHVLSPGEGSWKLPEGTAAPDRVLEARRALLEGVSHVLNSWIHLLFLLVLGLLGGYHQPIRLVTAFTVGQLVGALVTSFVKGIGAVPAEISLAVGVAILARQAIEPVAQRRRLWALAIASGLIHGMGITAWLATDLGDVGVGLIGRFFAVLGMDAAHLLGALCLTWLLQLSAKRPTADVIHEAAAYSVGVVGLALAIALSLDGGAATPDTNRPSLEVPVSSEARTASGVSGSQRLAPATPDAAVQSFIAVEPFEVRHEVMIRLAGLAEELGLDMNSTLEVEQQTVLCERLATLVRENTLVEVDGQSPRVQLRRADFMTVDPTGALPRPEPMPEPVSEAVVGLVFAYPTTGVPEGISLRWKQLPQAISLVPTTLIDPENVTVRTVSAQESSVRWENKLVEDPIPTMTEVEVEPIKLPVPWLSLPLLAIAGTLSLSEMRGRRSAFYYTWARVALALAVLAGPVVQTAFALPGSAGQTPSQRQARRILSGLLPNIYRAMEFREEAVIYDRLAISTTGETLAEVYLGQRKALEVEERGGAQARVETVEVLEADGIQSLDSGFGVRSLWTVGGIVTHFGHRHFRQNRYNAWIEVVPVEGTWKIQSIEVIEQERVK
jgi:hypothetical protein